MIYKLYLEADGHFYKYFITNFNTSVCWSVELTVEDIYYSMEIIDNTVGWDLADTDVGNYFFITEFTSPEELLTNHPELLL